MQAAALSGSGGAGMTYLALARRYRPRRFEEVVGQQHVVRALSNALEQGRLHHAYQFSGTRGIGKTTIARIFARCLNCERGVSAHPCGECGACRAFDAGRFVDLIEVDAASRTKVEETRDLLETVPYAPAQGRYKVYLIDEVHMLSTSSFNALLKTLEEPPEHVKFLLATTEPEKVPLTVLSRCISFALHRLPVVEMEAELARILAAEDLEAEPAALAALARAARGSMRDALSLLDQALAFGGGQLGAQEVAAMLGTADRDAVYELLDRLAANDGAGLLEALANVARGAADADEILDALAEALALVARRQVVPDAPLPAGASTERVEALAAAMGPEAVQLDYDIALAGRRDLAFAPDPLAGLEMTLLRMLAFQPDSAPAAPAKAGPKPQARRSMPAPRAAARDPAPEGEGEWEALLARMEVGGMARELAQHCVLAGREGDLVRLRLDSRRRELHTPTLEKALEKALGEALDAPVKLKVEIGEPDKATPAAKRSAREAERLVRARQAIEDDPHVAALRETFGAEIISDTVRPED